MKIKTLLIATLLCFNLAAVAQDQVVSQAYEVALSDFRAPATENGGAAFKPCGTCNTEIVRVTSGTQYLVNGKAMSLEKFRQAIVQTRDRDEKSVTVLHHLESDTIVSVSVYI